MDKENVLCSYNGVLLDLGKEETLTIWGKPCVNIENTVLGRVSQSETQIPLVSLGKLTEYSSGCQARAAGEWLWGVLSVCM
jgi:hypothetical protein